jgi:hypothetical protein
MTSVGSTPLIDESIVPPPAPRAFESWRCHACGYRFPAGVDTPISILTPDYALLLCSDLCAVSSGYADAALARGLSETNGLGISVVVDPGGYAPARPPSDVSG